MTENGHAGDRARIGVVALNGDAGEHRRVLETLGVEAVEVRGIEDLNGISGLIVPGDESAGDGEMMVESGLLDGIRTYFYQGGAVWGTCAGMVLAASATTGERQPLIGLMNALAVRDGFERQIHSFEADLAVEGFEEPFVGIFIRAPYFEDVGPGVEVLSELGGKVVAARADNVLVTAFRPELSDDVRFHRYFLEEVCAI